MKQALVFLWVFGGAVFLQAVWAQTALENGLEKEDQAKDLMFQNGVVSGLSCFEGLLRGNLEDRRIYDAYAQTLIDQGKFDESIKVYESTLQTGKPFVKSGVAGRSEEYKALRQNKKFDPEPIASEADSFGKNPSCRIRPWVSSLMG